MPRRFDAGPALAVLGAAILAIALFLDWFDPGVTAWEAFESLDLVLIALAGAIAYGALHRDGAKGRIMLLASLAAFLVVVTQLIQPPPLIDAATDSDLAVGAWLGLIGTVLAMVGSVLVVAAISINVDVAGRDGRRRATAVDHRTGASSASGADDEDDEELEDDDFGAPVVRRPDRAAQRPASTRVPERSGGSLFSRGPARDEEDELDDTVAAPVDPQATQTFPAQRDDDARPGAPR